MKHKTIVEQFHAWRELTYPGIHLGELDGGPGDHWTTTECRVCGAVKPHNAQVEARRK